MIAGGIDFDLSPEQTEVRELTKRFAREVLRPAGEALDRVSAEDVAATGSIIWEIHKKWDALGIRLFGNDAGGFPPAELARLGCLITEELGWGDGGLAISLGAAEFPAMLAGISQNAELMEEFNASRIGCWAITEPDHGSDVLDFGNGANRPALDKPNCIARRHGDDYVINGQKAAWVSNGPIAATAALYTAIDDGKGAMGRGVILLELDSQGVTRGKPIEKLGQRPLPQGELFFEDVRVPGRNLVIPPEMYPMGLELTLCSANGYMGSTFVGLAQAALEHAIQYAKERVQGGVPIIRHQAVKLRLFEMFRKVEAARSLNRRAVAYNAVNNPFMGAPADAFPAVQYAIASKVTSTQTAFEVASDALQVFGGNGLSREYPIEKLLRDARASLIEDGANDVLALHAADKL
jgi:acyl-CoA dehydrogenase